MAHDRPEAYVGDPAYDLTQHLLDNEVRLTADPRAFVSRLADLAGVDPDRVTAWLFARLVVEAGWWPYDVAALARTLRP